MSKNILDVMMHPVRMRIITTIAGREWTASQLSEALPDVAQATLYRHIKALEKGDILRIVAENPVRGTVEKVYALTDANLHNNDPDDASADDHLRYFTAFVMSLIAQFEQYIHSKDALNLANDGVGYHTTAIHVTDEELMQMARQLNEVMLPYIQNAARADRKRIYFSTILVPDSDTGTTNTQQDAAND